MGRCTSGREIGDDLPDHGGEFEAVTGAGRSDNDVGGAGQSIDEEVAVGGHGIEACLGGEEPAVRRWDMLGEGRPDQGLIARGHRSVVSVGIDRLVAVVMLGDLDPSVDVRAVECRSACHAGFR